ncbi:kynurenine 3-monooxygenase-like protein [Calycina marina]|uniref:Kynurenine 3-monooxygenase n=1 Tax=Calycina marina TaxID=1763456 RepID=A0A9P7YY31_9HELO|nr:kynurenine 3-monooxygenase-like protein [Calycina marina]
MSQLKTVVVGAGPVGALAALYAAQRGQTVEVYELRADLRDESTIPLNFTKSINLTLSERGTNAIHHSGKRGGGILKTIVKETVPMDGRMIHGKDLTGELTNKAQAYDVNGRALLAADRGELNKILLDGLEQFPNVKLFFNHKLTGADFKNKKAWFEIQDTNQPDAKIRQKQSPQQARNQEVEIHFDFMIGADGAHSATRYHLMKYVRMDYQQEYIDTLWCEFTIPPNTKGPSKWAISPNHLHIWPAKDFMFIAIPSSDGSFTCTLFMPSALFESLDSKPNEVPKFFDRYFPGVTNVIQPDALINSYLTNPHLPLISIRCRPYHFKDCAVIIGDAAHAMVPFYGQGMNAGLEDVNVLYRILDAHPSTAVAGATLDSTRAAALDEYSTVRAPDAYSINELALQNYIEMRASVTSPVYKLRKWLEETLSVYAPELGWQTQYSRVSFGNEPYAQVIKKSKRQSDVLLMSLMGIITGPVIIGALAALYRLRRGSTGFWFRLFEQ